MEKRWYTVYSEITDEHLGRVDAIYEMIGVEAESIPEAALKMAHDRGKGGRFYVYPNEASVIDVTKKTTPVFEVTGQKIN